MFWEGREGERLTGGERRANFLTMRVRLKSFCLKIIFQFFSIGHLDGVQLHYCFLVYSLQDMQLNDKIKRELTSAVT